MRPTGRGADSNRIEIAAGNGLDAWIAQTAYTPPLGQVDSADEWIVSRWGAAVAWLNRWPESESGIQGYYPSDRPGRPGDEVTLNVATVAVAHWGLETRWGEHEYNWNAGGIHCALNSGDCFREAESAGGEEFRSFDTFADFADAYFTMISRTPDYARAWEAFKQGSANGIMRLWAADYTCGAKTRAEATSLVQRVTRVVAAGYTDEIDALLPSATQVRATDNDVPNRCTPTSRNRGGVGGAGGSGGGGNLLLWGAVAALGLMALNRE